MASELFDLPKHIDGHVGGLETNNDDSNQEYVIDNIKHTQPSNTDLIRRNNTSLNLHNELNKKKLSLNNDKNIIHDQNKYDPYIGYLHNKGLIGTSSNFRYNIYTLSIDSKDRVRIPSVNIGKSSVLNNNPLQLVRGSNKVLIKYASHNLFINDKITLTGIPAKNIQVSSSGIIIEDNEIEYPINSGIGIIQSNQTIGTIFEFTPGSKYMKIKHTHFLPVVSTYTGTPGNLVFSNDPFYDNFDLSNLIVEIKDFQGNRDNISDIPYYDNISTNYINKRHSIILKDPITNRIKRNVFFIELPRAYQPIYSTNFEPPKIKYNFKLIFYYLAGIPVNLLNAEYPIDYNYSKGFHVITNISTDTLTFETNVVSAGIADSEGNLVLNGYTGGSNITCSQVIDLIKGYPDPNVYNIQLERVFTNIVSAKITSSEFPNTEKIIKNYPENRRNNKIYWQNLEDGSHIYEGEITPGNYKANELEIELEKVFYNIPRINYEIDNPSSIKSNFVRVSPPYTNHNYIRVKINEITDIVTFKSYIEKFFSKPILSVEPEIPLDNTIDPQGVVYSLNILHENHGLVVGDSILIAGAIAHLGIPAVVINNEHKISEVVDINTYKIKLQNFNLETTRNLTHGGNAMAIYIPSVIRFLFNKPNTIGTILGFRNVGETNSVTPFKTVISNNEKYEYELDVDEFGQTKTFKNNAVILSGDNYVHMLIKQLQLFTNLGKLKDFFTKISLPDVPGNILFNTFISSNKIFYEPIARLSELDIEFYAPDGSLYDFNGVEHSFTIEITTLDEIPYNTGISAKSGKIN